MTENGENASEAAIDYADPSTPTIADHAHSGGIGRGDVAVLALRIFSLYLLSGCVPLLAIIPALFTGRGFAREWSAMLVAFAPYAVQLGAAIVLWSMAFRIANWVLPGSVPPSQSDGMSTGVQRLQSVAISILGLFVVASALPTLARALYGTQLARSGSMDEQTKFEWLQFVLQAAFGVALFFGANGLTSLWGRLRHPESTQSDEIADQPRDEDSKV